MKIVVPKAGLAEGQETVRAIHTRETDGLMRAVGGDSLTIRRASHVDVTADLRDVAVAWLRTTGGVALEDPCYRNLYWADLLPVEGPVLGPFHVREDALAAEVAWLDTHHIPVPKAYAVRNQD